MNRELMFRAWAKKRKDYRELDQLVFDKHGLEEVWVFPEDDETQQVYHPSEMVIEQYTGLKDKNGKEIYEGDIMRFDAIDYEIYWSSDFSGWHNRRTDKGERIYGSNSFEEVTRFGSVIGNIHENPELLGGK